MTEQRRPPGSPAEAQDADLRTRLVGTYRLDADDERFMQRFNDALAAFEEDLHQVEPSESLPNLFVVGAPRSGTTLLVQVLASQLELGWISNLAAGFWRAPCVGIRLHRRWLGDLLSSDYQSSAGRTGTIAEPHEFGYFWTRLLGHGLAQPEDGHEVDWPTVRRTLLNMDLAWGRPIVFKAFQLGYHVADTVDALPRSLFVHIHRDPVDAASSLLRTRVALTGSVDTWISVRPRGFEAMLERTPEEQVAWQIVETDTRLRGHLERLPEANVVELTYDELIDRPAAVVDRVRHALERHGCTRPSSREPIAAFGPGRVAAEPSQRARIAAAIQRMRIEARG